MEQEHALPAIKTKKKRRRPPKMLLWWLFWFLFAVIFGVLDIVYFLPKSRAQHDTLGVISTSFCICFQFFFAWLYWKLFIREWKKWIDGEDDE